MASSAVLEDRVDRPARDRDRPRPRGWWFDAVLLAGFVAITVALLRVPALLRLDLAVRDWCDSHRPAGAHWTAWLFNHLGQGTPLAVLALVIAIVLAVRRHTVRPVLPVLGAEILTYCTVGPLKLWTERGAPHYGSVALFSEPQQMSYPSGHLVNTIVWYAVLVGLLTPWLPTWLRGLARVAPPVILAITTIYLGFHWFTDTVAGVLLGVFVYRVMVRIPWDRIPLPRALDRPRT